jgi:D-alanyl-D-alanine carboxypeptidase
MTDEMKKAIFWIVVLIIVSVGSLFAMRANEKRDMEIIPLSARASYLTTDQSLVRVAAPYLEKMILAAEKDGKCLVVLSGYRTFERQQKIWDEAEDKSIVAKPGTSEHEEGLAVDFGGCPMIDGVRNDAGERMELKNDFETLPEYQWLVDHAKEYGFEQSYTKENVEMTGYPAEPWHWRFQI